MPATDGNRYLASRSEEAAVAAYNIHTIQAYLTVERILASWLGSRKVS